MKAVLVRFIVFAVFFSHGVCQAQSRGRLEFQVLDIQGKLIPCRIYLENAAGTAQKASGLPFWNDHFACPGQVSLELEPGEYSWEIRRGPETRRVTGKVTVFKGKKARVVQSLQPLVDMREAGWFSGDMHVHRKVDHIELLMKAGDLDFAPVITWWNQPAPNATRIAKTVYQFGDGRVYTVGAGEDERQGGALLMFGLDKPLDLSVISSEYPSPMVFVQQARQENSQVWIDVEKPFWWDVPTWLAMAKPDSIGIAHNHMHESGVLDGEAWGRPRNLEEYAGVHGNGRWTQQIYYHVLNSGIRIPPSAGSASGVLPNPVGYNRVYVQLGADGMSRDGWFRALKAGRCFVSNGPLLRVKANGLYPGEEFTVTNDSQLELEIDLASSDPVSQIEIVYNGTVVKQIQCSGELSQKFKAKVKASEPGWLLVRAIADVDTTFRFASTAPWYVNRPDAAQRISRSSTQFFLRWLDERIEGIQKSVPDIQQRESVIAWHVQARRFWMERNRLANAELRIPRDETWDQSRFRFVNALRAFRPSRQVENAIVALKAAKGQAEYRQALKPLIAIDVSINPESRVKVSSRYAKLSVSQNEPTRFLVQIDNTAGITAPLNLAAFDVAENPPGEAQWCDIQVVDGPFNSPYLSGAKTEFKVVQITPTEAGLREVRIVGDAGQGTQDLGFRATADILLDTTSVNSQSKAR